MSRKLGDAEAPLDGCSRAQRRYCVAGGGGKGEPAVDCIGGGGGKPDPEVCGGSGNVLLALAGVLATVSVLEADWRGLGLRKGLGGGGTTCSTTCTGLGTSVGGGALSQNEWSGGSPAVT